LVAVHAVEAVAAAVLCTSASPFHAIKPTTAGTGVSTMNGTPTGALRPLLKRDTRP
jgi:hypothetical protein